MRFIEVHTSEGDRVIVNVEKIITIEECYYGSTLTLIDSQIEVKEKPDEIIIKIRG